MFEGTIQHTVESGTIDESQTAMAKILNYYALCPINDVEEFLGLSPGAEPGTVINTLGRNIISTVKVSSGEMLS